MKTNKCKKMTGNMNKNVKRALGLMALILDLLTGCVGIVDIDSDWDPDWDHAGDYEASAAFSQTVPLSGRSRIRVIGANGSVQVVGIPGAQDIVVAAVRRVRSDSHQDARNHLADVQISTQSRPKEFEIKTVQPNQPNGRTYIVDYEITVPAHLLPVVTNGNGSIRVDGIKADVEVTNGNGTVDLLDVTGSSWVSVGNGEVSAWTVLPDGGEIVHSIGNGTLFLSVQKQVSATFGAQVGNGTINVVGLDLQQVVSGPRSLKGILGSGAGLIDLSSGNGQIRVQGG